MEEIDSSGQPCNSVLLIRSKEEEEEEKEEEDKEKEEEEEKEKIKCENVAFLLRAPASFIF